MKFTRMVGYVEYSIRATSEAGAEGASRWSTEPEDDLSRATFHKSVMLRTMSRGKVEVESRGCNDGWLGDEGNAGSGYHVSLAE